MPSIAVPRQFFEKERDTVYGAWQTAFWRELISNALDAGASQIVIRSNFNADGEYVVDVVDNGCGMDRDTIENVYMCLGKSTKDADGSGIGGFGRARVLTCFSQLGYRLRSGDTIASGTGATYDIVQSPKSLPGCAVTVRIDPRFAARVQRGLRQVLAESDLDAKISLMLATETPDGVSLAQPTDMTVTGANGAEMFAVWKKTGTAFRTLSDDTGPWAHVYAQDKTDSSYAKAIMRVDGMSMYVDEIRSSTEIVVEMVPARSREVLTANRDGMRDPFRTTLNALFAELAIDGESATIDRAQQVSEINYNSAGAMAFAMPGAETGQSSAPPPIAISDRAAHYLAPRTPVGLRMSNASAEQIAAADKWRPAAWALIGNAGRNAEMLHAAWTGACRHVVTELCKLQPHLRWGDRTWATGFVIDKNFGGMHAAIGDVEHVLMLNPVDDKGRASYKISDPASMKAMISIAIHEVTHIAHGYHDEAFAGTFTRLVGAIRDKDIEAAIKAELDDCRAWQKQRDKVYEDVFGAARETPGYDAMTQAEKVACVQDIIGKPVDTPGSELAKNVELTLSPEN